MLMGMGIVDITTEKTYVPDNKPELIIFDLDYTLWPFYTDSQYTYPYHIEKKVVKDTHGTKVKTNKDSTSIIEYLSKQGYQMGIASKTTYTKEARQLIELFGWTKYFKYFEIYGGSKVTHFRKISKDSGIAFDKILFFDDEYINVTDLTPLGVTVAFIQEPLNWINLEDGMRQYNDK